MIYRISIVCSLLFTMLHGQYRDLPDVVTKVATAAGNWLKLETDARAMAMGGAFVAAGRGVSGIPYNASAIAYLSGSELVYGKSSYIAGITHNVVSYGRRLSGSDFFGLHLFYLDSGPMAVTNEFYPDGTGEDFRALSMALRFTYARRLTDRLKVGGSLNYIRDEIYTTLMQTIAFDLGSNFDTGIYGFVLGMSISNFGPEVQYHGTGLQQTVPDTIDVDGRLLRVTEDFPLPLLFRLGVSNDILGKTSIFKKSDTHRLTVAVDGLYPSDYTVYTCIGLEYGFKDLVFVRGGTHFGHDTAGFSVGLGTLVAVGSTKIAVDYAYVDYGVLKTTHQISIGLKL